ncbi:DNA mismatch repair protein MutS [Aneurinibacillus migulanus]|uniref:endonuclease MutS2 n=1 Tax=Aneurinibacillus migulanus TaxID=47500 RepID=UPI002E1CB7ED|nr:DNA mismatch repair protein MutS [Aneurinibacillus migulanus]
MNEKTLRRLEYDKIKETLKGYAISYMGKKHVEHMIPMTSGKILRKKLDETAEAKSLLQYGASVPIPSLEGIENILTLLGTGYVFSEKDFSHIHQFLTSCAQLMKYMAAKSDVAPRVSTYTASMYTMNKLKSEIEQSIHHGQVIDTASKDLMKVRKRISVMEERLKSKLDSLMSKYRSILQENVISTRNGRYVIPIKKEYRKQVTGRVLDESASGQTVYMEPNEISNLQFEITALKAEEEQEVTKVLIRLSALAEESAHELQVNVETVGTYDFLFAKAKYALAIAASNVEINEEGIIELHEAKHPLLGKQMIPLNFQIGYKYKSLIITGPNTGGKTLTLKTVGLLTAMVQSGLLVPVQEGSKFSIFSNIAVDIGDGQSIEHALSTFSAHVHNVIDILKITDRSTLVLIDEMASGTDPGEGVGLSVAILEELHRRKATVVVTTHFNEIKNFAAVTPGFENARMEFDTETLQPLYRLRIGEAGQSYAFSIALKLGIPSEIIQRSREITTSGFSPDILQKNCTNETSESNSKNVSAQSESQLNEDKEVHEEPSDNRRASSETVKAFELGDCVYVSYLGRTGIVFQKEDSKGNVGVMIQKQKYKINKKRLVLQIESKDLYPEDYDLDIVFETKENRKKRKLMNRKYVEGLSIDTKREE